MIVRLAASSPSKGLSVRRFATCFLLLRAVVALDSAALAQVVDASVCDGLADPPAFDGKVIRIRAVTAVAGFDEFLLDGSGCNPAGGSASTSQTDASTT